MVFNYPLVGNSHPERAIMNQQTNCARNPIVRLISRIQSEYIRQTKERRGNHRQAISIPAKIKSADRQKETGAITRELSSFGIGLITKEPVEKEQAAEILLDLANCEESLFATCRWCREYGEFFISGWKFTNN